MQQATPSKKMNYESQMRNTGRMLNSQMIFFEETCFLHFQMDHDSVETPAPMKNTIFFEVLIVDA